MSAVNWGEVFYISWRRHGEAKAREAEGILQEMPSQLSRWIGRGLPALALWRTKHGLGYADALAAELAMERGAWLVTADPEFSKLGRDCRFIRCPDTRSTDVFEEIPHSSSGLLGGGTSGTLAPHISRRGIASRCHLSLQ